MIQEDKGKPEKKDAKKTFKSFNPKKFVNTQPELKEAVKKDLAVISFGRMNPITVGHEKLVNKILATAIKMKGTPLVFLSHTADAKKNPLSYETKLKFAQKAFGKVVVKSNARQIIDVAVELQNSYKNLAMVVGDDRVAEFERILNNYNGKDFTFDSVKVVSAGQRDPDADGVEGVSGSKMRSFAADGNVEEFKRGLPKSLQGSSGAIFNAVRGGMGLSEDLELESDDLDERILDNAQRRKMAITMKKNAPRIARARERSSRKKASSEKLKGRSQKAALSALKKRVSVGKDSGELSTAQKNQVARKLERIPKGKLAKLAKKMLPAIRAKEKERFANRNIKKEDANEAFENFINERNESSCQSLKSSTTTPQKRFHMLLNKDNSTKIDKRFKMYKPKNVEVKESIEESTSSVLELQESVENYMSEAPFAGGTNFFKSMMPGVESWIDRNVRGRQYKAAVGQYIKFKKEGIKDALVRASKIWNVDTKTLETHYNNMVSAGVVIESVNEKFERFMNDKSGAGEEGTDELVKTLKKDTPKGNK